jgi:hypothetical protein
MKFYFLWTIKAMKTWFSWLKWRRESNSGNDTKKFTFIQKKVSIKSAALKIIHIINSVCFGYYFIFLVIFSTSRIVCPTSPSLNEKVKIFLHTMRQMNLITHLPGFFWHATASKVEVMEHLNFFMIQFFWLQPYI